MSSGAEPHNTGFLDIKLHSIICQPRTNKLQLTIKFISSFHWGFTKLVWRHLHIVAIHHCQSQKETYSHKLKS